MLPLAGPGVTPGGPPGDAAALTTEITVNTCVTLSWRASNAEGAASNSVRIELFRYKDNHALFLEQVSKRATEGTWQWLGDSGSYAGETFLKGNVPHKGAYNNFRAGEPNNNGEEDCLKMDPDGQWVDDSCYKQYEFFFVEFEK